MRILAVTLVSTLLTVTGGVVAPAKDKPYGQPIFGAMETGELDIVIIPPVHGPLVNEEVISGGPDPMSATPFNAYLDATEDSIYAWRDAVRRWGPRWLKKGLKFNIYVIGRDVPDLDVVEDPEVVIVFDESKATALGLATWTQSFCLVNNSMWWIYSFTYADMYNVNAQEFGHCLGLGHVTFPPLSGSYEPDRVVGHDVMNGTYADPVGGASSHLHCVSNINIGGLEWTFADALANPGSKNKNPTSVTADEYAVVNCSQDPRSASG